MRKGHKVGYGMGGYGGYQAIMYDAKIKFTMVLQSPGKTGKPQDFNGSVDC